MTYSLGSRLNLLKFASDFANNKNNLIDRPRFRLCHRPIVDTVRQVDRQPECNRLAPLQQLLIYIGPCTHGTKTHIHFMHKEREREISVPAYQVKKAFTLAVSTDER